MEVGLPDDPASSITDGLIKHDISHRCLFRAFPDPHHDSTPLDGYNYKELYRDNHEPPNARMEKGMGNCHGYPSYNS